MGWKRDDPLNLFQKLAYGLGHVQNEFFGAMWYSYLLLFLQFVVQVPVTTAGAIFLIGQLVDGLVTPLVAYHADRLNWSRYGKRKTVHLIGSVVTAVTFPFIFTRCLGCEAASYWTLVAYFVPLVCLYEAGWATVQMSHLSLIPELTSVAKQRDELSIIRYSFCILTDTAVYFIAFAVLQSDDTSLDPEGKLGPQNANIFQNMAIIMLVAGIVSTGMFHSFTPEQKGAQALERPPPDIYNCMLWKDWFKVASFYKVAILFSVSRVIMNMLQVFVPLYLQEGIRAPHVLIALVPLVINVSGFYSSLMMKSIMQYLQKKTLFMISAAVTFIGCAWFAWDDPVAIRDGNIYYIAIFSGVGASTMLVIALSLGADLVGDHTISGGFVFGCLALTEKVTNGLVILVFQAGRGQCTAPGCTTYYRDVLCYGVCFFTMVNLLTMLLLNGHDLPVLKALTIPPDDKEACSGLVGEKKPKYGAMRRGLQLFGLKD